MSTSASVTLSALQAQGLLQGLTVLTQRLSELSSQTQFSTEMVALAQPMATMQNVGESLRGGLSQPLQSVAITTGKTVAELKALIEAAVDAAGAVELTHISDTLETLTDRQILWLDLALEASTTLRDYTLDLGQSPSADVGAPSLLDQGLQISDIALDVQAAVHGNVRIGIDLRPGVSVDEAIVFKIDNLEACARASAVVEDVNVNYGILDLGALDAQVALESCVNINLIEGALGHLSLAALNTGAIGDLFSLNWPGASDSGADFSVDFEFDFGVGGFAQSGQTLTLGLQALNGFDLGTLELVLPEIQIDGASVDFDFTQFAQLSVDDLGNYLTGLGHWLPQLGQGFDLPVLDRHLGDLFDLGEGLTGLFDGLRDDSGAWSFHGIHGMIRQLASGLGIPEADVATRFALTWSEAADALEWTLPWSTSYAALVDFDANSIVPSSLPMQMAARAQAAVEAQLDFSITGGVALTSSSGVDPVTGSTLLSALNSGLGLTSQGLLSDSADIGFRLSDGSLVEVDLNPISGLGSASAAGTATVADLLTRINAASPTKLSASLSDRSTLVLRDLTFTGTAVPAFSVEAPSVSVTLSTRADGTTVNTTSTSVAPLVLGLWGAQGAVAGSQLLMESASLASVSPQDRLYIKEQPASAPLISATVTVDGYIEGGAALGPVSLRVIDGEVSGSAQWDLTLNDPATGADDGRIYLAELGEAELPAVLDHQLTSPSLSGVFQLAVTPDTLNTALGIDLADYSSDPLNRSSSDPDNKPDTFKVPYIELNLDSSSGWDFSIAPSEKLTSLFSAGWDELSWQDLPDLLDTLILSLEGTDLWTLPIPMTELTVGDLFGFRDLLIEFELPDLNALLGDLSGTASGTKGIGDWKLEFDADFNLAWTDLQGLDASLSALDLNLSGRIDDLQWTLSDLLLAWGGRDSGNLDFEADFLVRLGAWKSNLSLTLDDLNIALDTKFPSAGSVPLSLSDLKLTLQGLLDFIDAIPFGLDGFATLLEGLFMDGSTPRIPGLSLSVNLPTVDMSDTNQRVLFDLAFTLDPTTFTHTLALDALDLSGSPLIIDGAGNISAALGGKFNTQIGFDFGTGLPIFSLDDTHANLTLGVSTAAGTTLEASLGGLVGLSVGRVVDGSVDDPIVITLNESSGSAGPAVIKFNEGVSGLSGSAYLYAHLPLYLTSVAGTAPIVGVDLEGTLDLTPPVTGTLTPTITGNISSLFSQGDLGLSGWINGAILFIDALTAALESDLLDGLPLVKGIDLSSDGFLADLRGVLVTLQTATATTLGQVQATLNAALSNTSLDLDGTASFIVDGNAATSAQLGLTMEQLFAVNFDTDTSNDIDNFVIDLGLTGLFKKSIDFGALDLGFGPVELGGTGGLDLAASFGLNLGLGYSPSQGFFVQGTSAASGDELTIDLGLGMRDPSAISLDLGPLKFSVTDNTVGNVVTDPSSRELSATFGLDLGNGALTGAGADLLDDLQVTGEVMAKLDLELNSNVGLGMGMTTGFYEGEGTPIALSWSPGQALNWGGGELQDYLQFDLSGVYADFGSLFGPAISEMATRLAEAFEPMAPIVDMLTDEVPLISDLSKKLGQGSVTYLDAISWFGQGFDNAATFIETLDTLGELNTKLAASGRFYLGSLGLNSTSASALSTSTTGRSAPSLSYTADSGGQSDAVSSGQKAALFANNLGIAFPVLQSPSTELMNFLFGGEADLITWDIPDLNAGFELRKSFPIFPPLFVELFGGVNFQTNFDMGYDTRGLRLAMDSGDAADLLLGVYLHDDHSEIAGASNDPELQMTATIGAGAKLDVAVAQAGVEGGLRGTLAADLADPDDNGKVYVDELVDQISNGVECVFDLSGSLDVFLAAYIKVGVDTPFGFVTLYKDRFKLAEATILDWSAHLCEPTVPDVASASGSTLTLHMGSKAKDVIPGKTEDGDEVFLVEYSGGKTRVTAYGHTEEFSGIAKIVFDAGMGNDTVLIAPSVTATVEGRGGEGNDNLVGGSGVNTLWGDGGSDVLSGRAAGDSLVGGDGDDFLYGYGGADTLDGGNGDDALFGEDDIGDMIEFKARNTDFNAGTAGNDFITGGQGNDLVVAGDGNDTVLGGWDDDAIDAGAGDDSVEGGDGNDQLSGGLGNDKLYGDNKSGSTEFGMSYDDKIEGGQGYNEIWGGVGNDLLYAADEEQLASASGAEVSSSGLSSRIEGGDGADMIYGTAGRDWLSGGFESDYIDSGAGDDFLLGGPGGDALLAAGGRSTLLGGHGNDVIDGGDGANWIEGGPGHDQIYAREGADTVYGGTTTEPTKGGYTYLLQDLSGARAVDEAEHGGFRSTPAADSCGPEIFFYPEVYAPTGPLVVDIFNDTDRDGVRDSGETAVSASSQWQVSLIQAPDGYVAWQGAVTGGQLTRDVPDGSYEVRVASGPDNPLWPSGAASLSTFVQVTGGVASKTAQMGWYGQGSDIVGQVISTDGAKDQKPVAGAVVFIDTDKDGSWDAGESYTTTAPDGSYALRNLGAGTYTVAVADDGVCALSDPRSASVQVDGVGDKTQHFNLVINSAPVVSAVELFGGPSGSQRWWSVPDGNEQIQPIDPGGAVSKIAIELCSTVGVEDSDVTARLQNTINPKQEYVLRVVGFGNNRVEFALDGQLQFGSYKLIVDANTLTDKGKTTLDGEWRYPQGYDSGNGTAGGDFAFDFVLGTASTVSASGSGGLSALTVTSASTLPAGSVSLGTGSAIVHGQVWAHDLRGGSPAHDSGEVGLTGQTIELRDGSGTLITRLTTGLDLNGNGQISSDEAGAFRIEALRAGTYTVTQVPSDSWTQAYTSAAVPDKLFTVAAGSTGDSKLARVDANSGAPKVMEAWTLGGFRARDIAVKDADEIYAIGTGADGKSKLIHVQLGTALKITEVASPPEGTKANLVGMDLVGEQYLLATANDGGVLRYSLTGRNWTDLGKLHDGTLKTVYPVGDIAVASSELAYAVVAVTAPSSEAFPRADTKQYLLQFDPRTLATASMKELNTQSPLVGLDLASNGRLAGLDTLGRLYDINPATATSAGAMTIIDQPPASIGGLSLLKGGMQGTSSTAAVTVSAQDGKTTVIGFGNVPAPTVLPDGNDTIDGGCGPQADLLHGDDGALPAGVISEGGNDSMRGRDGNDTLIGGLQGDTLLGEAGDDSLAGGTSESNRMDGGDGQDMLQGGSAADFMFGGAGKDTLIGAQGADWLHGQAGNDSLQGDSGNDVLVGGAGDDVVLGGQGDDTLVVVNKRLGGDYAAAPEATGGGSYDGGSERDQLVVVMDGVSGTAHMQLGSSSIKIDGFAPELISNLETAWLVGASQGDTIDAAAFGGSSAIYGLAGNDTLLGGGSNDTLAGGSGQNSLSGAAKDDLYLIDAKSMGDTINEGTGGGQDTVDASAASTGLAAEINAGAANVSGGTQFSFAGNVERLLLGAGNDQVVVGTSVSSGLSVSGGAGSDTLNYSSWPATSPVSVNLATGTASGLGAAQDFENAIGGKGNDTLVGNAANNTLEGGEGHDSLVGAAGSDALLGQTGNDTLQGDAGQDTLSGGAGNNRMEGGADADLYQLLTGLLNDVINEAGATGGDQLNLSGITSTNIDYTIDDTDTLSIKFAGSSTVQAQSKAQIETVIGGGALDRFIFFKEGGTPALLDGGSSSGLAAGANALDYSNYLAAVTVQLPTKSALPGTATGTGGIKNIGRVVGSDYNDVISAGFAAATLEGGRGADQLTGSSQNDTLTGGGGNDTLVGGEGVDTAVFSGPRSNYTVAWNASTKQFTVTSLAEGEDKVSEVEQFKFSDASYSATALSTGRSDTVSVSISTWNGRSMKAVSLGTGATGDGSGSYLFTKPASPLTLSPSFVADATARSKVELTDAIQVLKSIVGLTTLNPYQSIAGDFNSNGSIDLSDAIGILKHIVGLSAPTPSWVFVNAQSPSPQVSDPLILGDNDVQLVGILKGDVDGSWVG